MSNILALDPSSKLTGYAIMEPASPLPALVECGLLRPHRTADDANARIIAMGGDVLAIVAAHKPMFIVIEDTSGKVARRHGSGGGAGLAVYGKAVGYMMGITLTANEAMSSDVVMVPENEWTQGRSKSARQRAVAALYPHDYTSAQDRGGDAADAIGLGLWWLARRLVV